LGCWLTIPLNHYFGRRGSIFFAATLSALTCVWQGLTSSWQHMFVARLMLGLGIGPKSATVPVFAAECAPPLIRGALVMQWQTWTAFGIMMGYIADIALYYVPDTSAVTGLNWRLMLGAASLPAWIGACQLLLLVKQRLWILY
jgi:MFS family permease